MNKLLILTLVVLMACNAGTETKTEAVAPAANDYAYTLKEPHEYEAGSKENLRSALAALKAFEDNNIAECVKYFGDTVTIEFDGFEARLPKDSLQGFFQQGRDGYKTINFNMSDYESVQTTDKKNEWVSLWYKQVTTDTKGTTDSAEIMNDMKFVNGKIVLLNEKTRKYMKK